MQHGAWERVPIGAQSVEAPLSRSAVFLVMAAGEGDAALAGVRDTLGAVGDLVKNVGFRDLNGRLSCVVGIGSALWDRLSPGSRPAELHPFTPIAGPVHAAPSTPGDLLFHLRAEREDMTFELERQLLDVIGDAAKVVDETTGFRYFDARDLLGFVDGTANPTGAELPDAALIAAEADPDFAGGSYVVVQKYVHDMAGWAGLSTEEQEAIMGRTKIDNVEIDDDAAPRKSHKSLATIEDDAGGELGILRDNMPFGVPARASSAPTSSATRAGCGSSSRCSSACSSACRPAATTGCSTSPRRSPGARSSCRPRACSTRWPSRRRTPPPRRRTPPGRRATPARRRRRRPRRRWVSARSAASAERRTRPAARGRRC